MKIAGRFWIFAMKFVAKRCCWTGYWTTIAVRKTGFREQEQELWLLKWKKASRNGWVHLVVTGVLEIRWKRNTNP